MEENERIEHIVEVDEYLEVKLKIPKRLNAMSLKALMTKATKLFNMAEIPIVQKRTYNKSKNGNRYNSPYSEEALVELKKWVKNKISYKKIVEKLKARGIEQTVKQVQAKVYNLKAHGKW